MTEARLCNQNSVHRGILCDKVHIGQDADSGLVTDIDSCTRKVLLNDLIEKVTDVDAVEPHNLDSLVPSKCNEAEQNYFLKTQWLDVKDAVTYSYSPSFSKSDTFPSLNERPWPDSFPSLSEIPSPSISELNKFPSSNERISPKTSATDNIALAEQF